MIRLPDTELPEPAAQRLEDWQAEVDAEPDYATRVALADRQFGNRNRPTNAPFRTVRATLAEMCCGAQRCAYCEDAPADEVEHILPKSLYPEAVFAWSNYTYACGPCNGPKNNRFAVFRTTDGEFQEVTRQRAAPVFPPEPGDPVLINPRQEDPLELMALDLRGTFFFVEIPAPGTPEYRRAEYTIDVLRLNARPYLANGRRSAYYSYRARLREYIAERDANGAEDRLEELIDGILRMHHPTVWAEMKRQRTLIPELEALFAQAPEALNW